MEEKYAVDRGQRHVGLPGDVAHLDRVVLTPLQQGERGVDDPVAALLLPGGQGRGVGEDGRRRGGWHRTRILF